MSHVDEGALHAYLDGALEEYPTGEARRIRAHLERCERCAEALTEARRIRDRAETLLAAPGLNMTPPPLEELKRLASSGRSDERASGGWGSRQRLGWAASVAVALGIGWVLRGGMPLPTVAPGPGGPTAESATASDTDAVRIGAVAEAPVERAQEADDRFAHTEAAGEAVPVSGTPAGTVVAEALAPSEPAMSEPSVMAEARPAATAEAEVSGPVAAQTLPGVDAMAVDTGQGARIDDDLDVPIDIAATTFTAAAPAPGAEPVADSGVPTAAAGDLASTAPATAEVEERRAASRSEAARLSLASRSAGSGAPLSRGLERPASDEDTRDDEASEPGSLVVPGLEVLSIVWREEGVVPAGVRVIQRLEDGGELELIHLPAGFDPSAVAPAEEGIQELVVPRDQGWLILRAALDDAELRALLERMDAPDPRR